MIRLILVVLSLILLFIFSIPASLVLWIVGRFSASKRDIAFLRIVQAYCRILLVLSGVRVQYIGRDRIPTDRSVLYIINHRSLYDIPLTLTCFPGITGYIAKSEYAGWPLLSWWIKWLHGYFLDRDNVREALKTILAGIDDLKNGQSVAVFPEGTRNKGDNECELLEFHEGTFKLSTKSGAPIIPVSICGSREILETQFPLIRSRRVIVEFGEPIDPASLTGDQKKFPGRYVRSIMMETMERNHKTLNGSK